MNDENTREATGRTGGAPPRREGHVSRAWRALRSPTTTFTMGGLLGAGLVLGVMLWGGFNWSLELTNTETFCISCHEMERNVYRELRDTVHYSNRTGVRATCPDCHVPKEWVHKVVRKIRASNERVHASSKAVRRPSAPAAPRGSRRPRRCRAATL